MYQRARRTPRDLAQMEVARSKPPTAHVVLHAKPTRGRTHRTWQGLPVHDSDSRNRERGPWLLMTSPSLKLSARQLVALYARRMQIELSFRDLKSHRYGQAFEDSLTRKRPRIAVLLLPSALAAFATWVVGMASEASGIDQWLAPFRSKRRPYSVMPLGREALVRRWLHIPLSRLVEQLRQPTPAMLNQMGIPT